MSKQQQLKAARQQANQATFGTQKWDRAMQAVRALVNAINDASPAEEFCSVDSGIHSTRLSNGKII